jgi:hypothetical protein
MTEHNNLIDLFSKEWEEKCRVIVKKCGQLDENKITEAEKLWRIKQQLKEITRPERRQKPRPQKENVEPVVRTEAMRERRKLNFHSQEWMDKCKEISEKCAQIENLKISAAEKLWRTKQLLKELTFVDKKRQAQR